MPHTGGGRLPVATAALCLALVLLHAWWLWTIRAGGPYEYDEAGYLSNALQDLHALQEDGLRGFARAALGQAPSAPLVPALAVPALLASDEWVPAAWSVQVVLLAALVAVTVALARRLVAAPWALLAGLVVGALPVVTDYTRLFHFAVPATALLTGATYALLRSGGLWSRWWALASGLLLGLACLSRTMMVAYVPGLVGAALVVALLTPQARGRRLTSWALLVMAAGVTSALWYLPNARSVLNYLLGSGYGARSAEYGAPASPVSPEFWLRGLVQLVLDVRLPLATVLVAAVLVALLGVRWRRPRAAAVRLWLVGDRAVLVLVVAEGYLALTSTSNRGTAFAMPWMPHLVVLLVACLAGIRFATARRVLAVALVAATAAGLLVQSHLVPGARPVELRVAGTEVPVLDPRGGIHTEFSEEDPAIRSGGRLPDSTRRTEGLVSAVAGVVVERAGPDAEVALVDALADPLVNSTRYSLAAQRDHRRHLISESFHPEDVEPGVSSYAQLLRRFSAPFLVTGRSPLSGVQEEMPLIEEAASRAGFTQVAELRGPEGREVRVWQR